MPADPAELEQRFWKLLRTDMTIMLGLAGVEDVHPRPMTAQLDGADDRGPIWFFTSNDTELVRALGSGAAALATFASRRHELFASIHGELTVDNDRAVIDRLWNPFVAAWFEGGKDDPRLTLLRFEPGEAEIWLDDSSLLTGIRMLLGANPKKDYKDNVATVRLD